MKALRIFLQILIPLAILAGGAGLTYYLYITRQQPPQKEIAEMELPVEVILAQHEDFPITVSGAGTVLPAREIVLQPQVSGLVTEQNDALIPGGQFKKGDLILRIDPRDYQYIVDQRAELVQHAGMQLKEEKSRKEIAEREWNLLGKEVQSTELGKELALRVPQIQSAEAALESAKSSLNKAKLDVERCEIRAPFNCWVKSESVDLGQLVNPQSRLAELVGTDSYWVEASIQTRDLPYIFVPGVNGTKGSSVRIVHDAGDLKIEREGHIIKLLGALNAEGRMTRVLIEVDDPLGLKGRVDEEVYPLMLDAFVRVEIEGRTVRDAVSIPEIALREGNRVWVRNSEGRLQFREVEVLRRRKHDILINGGVQANDQIVTSMLNSPLPGTKLNLSNTDTGQLVNSPSDKDEG